MSSTVIMPLKVANTISILSIVFEYLDNHNGRLFFFSDMYLLHVLIVRTEKLLFPVLPAPVPDGGAGKPGEDEKTEKLRVIGDY
jgi:hypothetical protein